MAKRRTIDEIVAEFAVKFRAQAARIVSDVQRLRADLADCQTQDQESDVIEELSIQSHSVLGVAATFGFDDVGRYAAALEAACLRGDLGFEDHRLTVLAKTDDFIESLSSVVERQDLPIGS